jgi:hypothetical protein
VPAAGPRFLARLQRARHLGMADWRDLSLAVVELSRARWRIARTPAARLLAELRRPLLPSAATAADGIGPERVGWAVQTAARLVPWRSDCLVQAIAAQRWLGRERRPTQLVIGVHKDAAGRFEAHAWLRCGSVTVTGGDVARFTPLLVPVED